MKKAPTKGRHLHQSGFHCLVLDPIFGRFGVNHKYNFLLVC